MCIFVCSSVPQVPEVVCFSVQETKINHNSGSSHEKLCLLAFIMVPAMKENSSNRGSKLSQFLAIYCCLQGLLLLLLRFQ